MADADTRIGGSQRRAAPRPDSPPAKADRLEDCGLNGRSSIFRSLRGGLGYDAGPVCGAVLEGRVDQRACSSRCRAALSRQR